LERTCTETSNLEIIDIINTKNISSYIKLVGGRKRRMEEEKFSGEKGRRIE